MFSNAAEAGVILFKNPLFKYKPGLNFIQLIGFYLASNGTMKLHPVYPSAYINRCFW
jgi:hypothetical protein